eukprot:tig00021127_g18851.t1
MQEYLDMLEHRVGRQHALSAACAMHFGHLHLDDGRGNFDKAIRLYEAALKLYEEDAALRVASKPGALADHAELLAKTYASKGDFSTAKQVLLRALALRHESQGSVHVATARTEYMLGMCLQDMKDPDGAEAYYKAAFAHEGEAGKEAAIARHCCQLPVSKYLVLLGDHHASARRLQCALGLLKMAVAIAERVCNRCVGIGDFEKASERLTDIWFGLDNPSAAEAVAMRLVSETERRMGPAHWRVGYALMHLTRFQLAANKPPELMDAGARRGWRILEATMGRTHPGVGEALHTLWLLYERAPHLDPSKAFRKIVYDWSQAHKRPPHTIPPGVMECIAHEQECIAREQEREEGPKTRLAGKLEQRRREREERQRAEEERERARQEAERAERAARHAADREAARGHVEGARWAPARKLLDALLKRSPGDFEARLLRIRCMAGAGQLEAAGREAEKAERELAGSGAGADALRRVQELRRHMAAELQRREEAKRSEEEEARRRAEEQQRERERQAEEAGQQRERERQHQQEARQAAEAAAAPEEAGLDCSICLGPLSAGPPPAALPCRHRFHGRCIEMWRASPLADGCPECRCPFDGPPAAVAGPSSDAGPSTPARAERAAEGPASNSPPLRPSHEPIPPTPLSFSEADPARPAIALDAPAVAPSPASDLSALHTASSFPSRPTRPYRPPCLFPT